mgnify:CR=1 FL=1
MISEIIVESLYYRGLKILRTWFIRSSSNSAIFVEFPAIKELRQANGLNKHDWPVKLQSSKCYVLLQVTNLSNVQIPEAELKLLNYKKKFAIAPVHKQSELPSIILTDIANGRLCTGKIRGLIQYDW